MFHLSVYKKYASLIILIDSMKLQNAFRLKLGSSWNDCSLSCMERMKKILHMRYRSPCILNIVHVYRPMDSGWSPWALGECNIADWNHFSVRCVSQIRSQSIKPQCFLKLFPLIFSESFPFELTDKCPYCHPTHAKQLSGTLGVSRPHSLSQPIIYPQILLVLENSLLYQISRGAYFSSYLNTPLK